MFLQQNSKKNNPKIPLNDDISIDDEDVEGSGFEDSHDLESSGSGYGPDDEDAAHGAGLFCQQMRDDKNDKI